MSAAKKPAQRETQPREGGWVPEWMAELGIEPSGALTTSKKKLRSLMRPTKPLKVQIWACLALHTDAYADEIAWIIDKKTGRKRPLRSQDISDELLQEAKKYYAAAEVIFKAGELGSLRESKEDIRRALASLDVEGLTQRETDDGRPYSRLTAEERQKLPNERTRIRVFVQPRYPDPEKVRAEWAARQTEPPDSEQTPVGISCLPKFCIPQILKALKIEIPEKTQISPHIYQRAIEAARKTFITELGLESVGKECLPAVGTECLPAVGNGGLPNTEIEVEKEIFKRPPSSSSSAVELSDTPPRKAEEEEGRALYQELKTGYPQGHFDEPNTKPSFDRLQLAQKRAVLERLPLYLNCERWRDEDGRWIPLSSNWIKTCHADPPPLIRKKAASAAGGANERWVERMRQKYGSGGGHA